MLEVRLVVLNAREPQAFLLRPPEVIIGRGRDCDLRIRARDISRRHCRIAFLETHVVLEDLGSTNGTLLNGKPVTGSQALKPGDIIAIGSARLKVESVGKSQESGDSSSGSVTPAHLRAESVGEEASVFVKLNQVPPAGPQARPNQN
jgi:pSer/pThr/pTyr-binding forkhead associated (FHA) protein